jgi:predicted NUDIX family NTP pyrophosphohydrolase
MTRTLSLGPQGFVVSDDVEGILGRFLNTNLLSDHAGQLEALFAPSGEGFWIPSVGGAQWIEDPALDPERDELWAVEREIPYKKQLQIVMTGVELRALLAEAQRLVAAQRG